MPALDEFLLLSSPIAQQDAIGLAVLFVASMLIFSDWRWSLAAYAGLQVLAGILLVELLPAEWALLQWIVGGLVGVMWFLAARRVDSIQRKQLGIPWWRPRWRLNPSTLQRLALLLILVIAIYLQRPALPFPRLPADLARFATFLALAGLLGLGLGDKPLRWGLCLSMWMLAASFAIHALQVDAGTVGLLAGVQILLGFVISYLIVVDGARFWPDQEQA